MMQLRLRGVNSAKVHNAALIPFVRRIFNNDIKSIYGDQTAALDKILSGQDRICKVLVRTRDTVSSSPPRSANSSTLRTTGTSHQPAPAEFSEVADLSREEPLGLVVVKTNPNDEYTAYGIKNSVEIKTLILDSVFRGRGNGLALLEEAEKYASKASGSSIHVFVRDDKPEALKFFEKHGFKRIFSRNSITKGVSEWCLTKRVQRQSDSQTTSSKTSDQPQDVSRKRKADSESRPNDDEDSEPKRPRTSTSITPGSSLSAQYHARSSAPPPLQSKCHRLPIKQPYFDWIRDGKKTVEGRINTGIAKRIQVGDILMFTSGRVSSLTLSTRVTKIESFRTFPEMLESIGVPNCLPDYRTVDSAVKLYRSLPGYADKERAFGVLALYVTPLVNQ